MHFVTKFKFLIFKRQIFIFTGLKLIVNNLIGEIMSQITPTINLITPQHKIGQLKQSAPSFGMREVVHYSEEESKAIIDSFNLDRNLIDDAKAKADAKKIIERDIMRLKKIIKRLQENIEILKNDNIVIDKILTYRKELQKELKKLEKRILQLK